MSNNVVRAINFVTILLSIPIIVVGVWLSNKSDNAYMKLLQWTIIIFGIVILVVAIVNFIGVFWQMPWLLFFYLISMLVLILLLMSLVIFIYMVTIRGPDHLTPGRLYLEYRQEDYSGWLRRRVESSSNPMANMDCLRWSNEKTQLYYSCKVDLLANLKRERRRAYVILIVALVLLISVYAMGCMSFKNAKTKELFRKYKQGYV